MNKHIALAALAATVTLMSSAAAFAQPGVATNAVNVRSGPAITFAKLGSLKAGELVDVQECQNGWCYVDRQSAKDGWVAGNYLKPAAIQDAPDEEEAEDSPFNVGVTIGPNGPCFSFGIGNQQAGCQAQQVNNPPPQGDKVCFYTDIQFHGQAACVPVGTNSTVLVPGWDNAIESIKIVGTGKAEICRDPNFGGGCVVYTSSQSSLPPSYANKVSSYDTYY